MSQTLSQREACKFCQDDFSYYPEQLKKGLNCRQCGCYLDTHPVWRKGTADPLTEFRALQDLSRWTVEQMAAAIFIIKIHKLSQSDPTVRHILQEGVKRRPKYVCWQKKNGKGK